MFGSATFTTVMSSRSMNVVVQTATSVQRRSGAVGAGSIAGDLMKPASTTTKRPKGRFVRGGWGGGSR